VTGLRSWEVWWVDFSPQVGSEQAGLRPAIIVGSSMILDVNRRLAPVVPCTTTHRGLPIHPPVRLGDRESYAMCEQLKSISVQRLRRRHPASLTPDEISRIQFVLRQVLDLDL